MPNWCSNCIIVEFGENVEAKSFFTNVVNMVNAQEERLESRLWDAAIESAKRDSDWSIGGDAPGLLSLLAPLEENSYDINIDRWGTKWDISQNSLGAYMNPEEDGCKLSFLSAWSPPIGALHIFAERLRAVCDSPIVLRLLFDESGVNFMGYSRLREDWDWDYECDSIDEVYNRAKAGDKAAIEFIGESGWSIEDLEESHQLPWTEDADSDDGATVGDGDK